MKLSLCLMVNFVREIIDAVKPRNTFYTLEPLLDVSGFSDSYLKLIRI